MAMNTPYYLNDIKTIEISKIREIPLAHSERILTRKKDLIRMVANLAMKETRRDGRHKRGDGRCKSLQEARDSSFRSHAFGPSAALRHRGRKPNQGGTAQSAPLAWKRAGAFFCPCE